MKRTEDVQPAGPTHVPPHGAAILPGTNIFAQWVFITPQMATDWLKRNHPNNRNRYGTVTGKYTQEMVGGGWVTTHQGIAWDDLGWMFDGQHRLASIADSGVGQWFLVTYNLTQEAQEATDRGKSRKIHDMMQIAGEKVDHDHTAVARVMICAPELFRCQTLIDSTVREYVRDNFEAIAFSRMLFPKKAGPAAFRGCVAKAWRSHDFAKLERFGQAAQDLIPFEEMTAVDHMVRKKMEQLKIGDGGNNRNLMYRKFQRLLLAYLQDEVLANLYESAEDLFPDPKS